MITLKKFATRLSDAFLLSFIGAQTALAQDVFNAIPDVTGQGVDVRQSIIDIVQGILSFLALVAVIVIIIAGVRLIVGGADEAQRTKARDTVLYAVVGLILILLSQAIVGFVGEVVS